MSLSADGATPPAFATPPRAARDVRLLDWLAALTADCSRMRAASISDQCHARCPYLPKVV